MSRKKKKELRERTPRQVQAEIWARLNWTALVMDARPEHRFRQHHRGDISGCCIVHEEEGPSFHITPSRGMAKCFGCGWFCSNPVLLVAHILKCTYVDALNYLKAQPETRAILPKTFLEAAEKRHKHQTLKNKAVEFCCNTLAELIVSPRAKVAAEAPWALDAIDWLNRRINKENFYFTLAKKQMIGILPPLNVFQQDPEFCQDEAACKFVEEYFRANIGAEGTGQIGWVMFIEHPDLSSAGRIKLRLEGREPKAMFVQDPFMSEEEATYYGLRYYREYVGISPEGSLAVSVYLHEGEFDSLHTIAYHLDSGTDEYLAISGGGGSVPSADPLAELGIKTVHYIPDGDDKAIGPLKHFLGETRSPKLNIKIFVWPKKYLDWRDPSNPDAGCKDADEAIRIFGYDEWQSDVRNDANYVSPAAWAFAEFGRHSHLSKDDDLQEANRAAIEWGKYVHNEQELRRYCRDVSDATGLDGAILQRDIAAANDDTAAFLNRIKQLLLETYSIESFEPGVLTVWNRVRKRLVRLQLDKPNILESTLANDIGIPLEFIRKNLGDPCFFADNAEGASMDPLYLEQRYLDWIRHALIELSHGAPPSSSLTMKRQGFHFIEDETEPRGYLVNGHDIWKLSFAGAQVEVAQLEVPRDGHVVFDPSEEDRWLPCFKEPKDIIEQRVDLRAVYDALFDIINSGWRFKYHDVDSQFFAAHLMTLPIADLFPRMSAVHVTGNAQSGKSKLVGGLVGTATPELRVIYHSNYMGSTYTPAGVRQDANGSSLCICLDEFEDNGKYNRTARDVENILQMLNDQLTNHQAGKIVLGSQNGRARKMFIRFPIITAAIAPLRNEASLSRFVTLEMARVTPEPPDQKTFFRMRYGNLEKFAELRRQLGLGMFHHVPAVRAALQEVAREFHDPHVVPELPPRFREALHGVLTIMKVAGLDYHAFAKEFAATRMGYVARTRGSGSGVDLIDAILDLPFEIVDEQRTIRSVREMLMNISDLNAINVAKTGIYLDVVKRWLVVHWHRFVNNATVVRHTSLRDKSPGTLKVEAMRSPVHVDETQVKKFAVLERLRRYMGFGIDGGAISVFDVSSLIETAIADDEARRSAPKPDDTGATVAAVAVVNRESVEASDREGV